MIVLLPFLALFHKISWSVFSILSSPAFSFEQYYCFQTPYFTKYFCNFLITCLQKCVFCQEAQKFENRNAPSEMNLTYCRTLTEKRIDIGYLIDFRTYLYQLEEGSSNRVNFFKDFLHMYVIVFFGFIFLTTSIVRLIDLAGLASWNVRIVR